MWWVTAHRGAGHAPGFATVRCQGPAFSFAFVCMVPDADWPEARKWLQAVARRHIRQRLEEERWIAERLNRERV